LSTLRIELDDPRRPHSVNLLKRHLDFTASVPPGIRHALDVDGLAIPSISFWTVWDGDEPVACAAIKELDARCGEVKSMHVISERRGQGIADLIVEHLKSVAQHRGYVSLALETGSTDGYIPARRMYARHGFRECEPFGAYSHDPMSTYMALHLTRKVGDHVFQQDDPTSEHAITLLTAHLAHAYDSSPPESVFALDPNELARPGIEFWTVWRGDTCAGCGALRQIGPERFEIKSMHTAENHRGEGVGAAMLDFLIERTKERGGKVILLETGSQEPYAAARRLYARRGFVERGPFDGYSDDPLSAFMERQLA
jgi:putative acetyltransferase